MQNSKPVDIPLSFQEFRKEILDHYKLAWISRHSSVLMRKEVLRGKAKFGIMGAGKELPQIALSKFFKDGDFRSGYYRDQTIALATEAVTVQQMFAILYSDATLEHEPNSAGRQMSSHFSTRLLDNEGNWINQLAQKNHSADSAPTASQMGRTVGLGLASKLYRLLGEEIPNSEQFSKDGNEIIFANIGDASTSEGLFFEAINAIAIQQLPIVLSIWDDGYGISVPRSLQTSKNDISKALAGFEDNEDGNGFVFLKARAWDYPKLINTYKEATEIARKHHKPVLVHITEATQPLGHSTSGSHQRYKDDERLAWESEFDCIVKMKQWILDNGMANEEFLNKIETEALSQVKAEMNQAWEESFQLANEAREFVQSKLSELSNSPKVSEFLTKLAADRHPKRSTIDEQLRTLRIEFRREPEVSKIIDNIIKELSVENKEYYNSKLFTDSPNSPLLDDALAPTYDEDSVRINGFEVLHACFDANFSKYPHLVAFGEDLGQIGGVNQCFAGLQKKYGQNRIFDTGIREGTIMGQAIGLAMRGFRPIAEIQYLDYMLYGLQQLSDEVSTLSYRTKAGQKSPVIIRTRGHRLEGIWHTGSPMGMIINAIRGMHVLTPRNMTQAAGMYNTLLRGDEPALLIEPLNAYRLKELLPANIAEFTVPLGQIEVLRSGTDVSLVTYGSCVRIAQEASDYLDELGISIELIDVQSLLPFDRSEQIVESLKKTNRLVILDEDVPGGASAFILNEILHKQNGFVYLDSAPKMITAKENRTGYGNEYNYFNKPQSIDVVDVVYQLMHDSNPSAFPPLN